jgi:5-methyltetrahydrofolate--homocysteine methyltransferase
MKTNILDLLQKRVVLFDGGFGTMLISMGLDKGKASESWNLEHPEKVKQIHKAYFDAGSDIIITNTFGATKIKLAAKGLDDKADEINKAAARLALEVCPEDGYVAGDIGPTGKFLKPMGEYTYEQFYQAFIQQAEALASAGVDAIIVETMYSLNEAKAAVKAAKDATELPIFATMTFNKTKKGFFTLMGEKVGFCLEELEKEGASVVGANCTLVIDEMVELAPILRKATTLPILVQPNAGKPVLKDGKTSYVTSAEDFAASVSLLIDAGINAIGGCCGTDPTFIKRVSSLIKG